MKTDIPASGIPTIGIPTIGIPREIMVGEGRVALTPLACAQLVGTGASVFVQTQAGIHSGYEDKEYERHGAVVVASAAELYGSAELIVKVKQPLAEDLGQLKAHHTVFSYLHLAADVALIDALCAKGLRAIPFESVADGGGHLPLLAPMSQVAGRIAVLRGASLLFRNRGGRGILLGGIDGAESGNVVVLGAGVAGSHAIDAAVSLGAQVDVLELNQHKLNSLHHRYPGIGVHLSDEATVSRLCQQADLVVGAVLLAGRRAPVVLRESVVKAMRPGSVIVDIAIDQGGCVEGIRQTDGEEICYTRHGVIHSAVPNMPAAVARTATQSLSSAILPYVIALATGRVSELDELACLDAATAIAQGAIVDPVLVQEAERLHSVTD